VIDLIAFMIIGYSEVSPGMCKLEYLKYDEVQSLIIPCDAKTSNNKREVLKIITITK